MKGAFLSALLISSALPAYAADIVVTPIGGGDQMITIEGQIGPDDFDTFQRKASLDFHGSRFPQHLRQQGIHETQEFARWCKGYWCADRHPCPASSCQPRLENCGNRSEKGQSDAAQQGYQRTILHNKLRPSRNEMPEKWCFQGTSCEANSLPWKSRLAEISQTIDVFRAYRGRLRRFEPAGRGQAIEPMRVLAKRVSK